MSRAALAMTGAAPVPVPPPMPAAMKHMCAPSSAFSTCVDRLFGGRAADLGPRAGAEALRDLARRAGCAARRGDCLSACASVLATMKSTPWTSARIMLAIALPPAPPTPITRSAGVSSSTSGGRNSMLIALSPHVARRTPARTYDYIVLHQRLAADPARNSAVIVAYSLIIRPRRRHQPADHRRSPSAGAPIWCSLGASARRSTGSDAA